MHDDYEMSITGAGGTDQASDCVVNATQIDLFMLLFLLVVLLDSGQNSCWQGQKKVMSKEQRRLSLEEVLDRQGVDDSDVCRGEIADQLAVGVLRWSCLAEAGSSVLEAGELNN